MKKAEVVKDLVYEEMLSKRLQRDYEMAQKFKLEAEEERRQKEEEMLRSVTKQKIAILNLQRKGMTVVEIASVFGITEEEVNKFIS